MSFQQHFSITSTNHCCLSLSIHESCMKIYRIIIIIILYGGSLGSLFDEERSKVRESNANCRTHWAWITRTHLAAKILSRLNLLQSCFHHIKFIFFSFFDGMKMNCWQVQWSKGYLACKTYLTYTILSSECCIRTQRSYTHNTQFTCVHCHNMRNLYHIHVIDLETCGWRCKGVWIASIRNFKLKSIRRLAELKHINKQRKRNQLRLP